MRTTRAKALLVTAALVVLFAATVAIVGLRSHDAFLALVAASLGGASLVFTAVLTLLAASITRVPSPQRFPERRNMPATNPDGDGRYHALIGTSFDAVLIHDFQGHIIEANEAALTLLGCTREELPGLSAFDFLDGFQKDETFTILKELPETGEGGVRRTVTVKRRDWTSAEAEVVASLVPGENGDVAVLVVARDVSYRVRAEEVLRGSEDKFREIFENVQDIFYRTDARGIITEISSAVERWGYTREELIGTQVLDVYADPDERQGLLSELLTHGEVTDHEVRLRAADGGIRNTSVGSHIIRGPDGAMIGVEGVLRDVTERKKAEDALREQMRHDPLTGVFNHAAIVEELRNIISDDGRPCAVLMNDVDNLKAINDIFGHTAGDGALVAVARSLSADSALVGRYGGDEFIAVLPDAGRDEAELYKKGVLETVATMTLQDPQTGAPVPVSLSMGIAICPIEANRIEELIQLADRGMYADKRRREEAESGLVTSHHRRGDVDAARIVGEIVPYLTTTGNLEEKLRLVARRLSVAANYDAVSFVLFRSENDGGPSLVTFARGPERLLQKWNSEEIKLGQLQRLARTDGEQRRPQIMHGMEQHPRFSDAQRELLRRAGLKSGLTAPMHWRNELIGILAVASERENAFTPHDAQVLTAVATQVTAIVSLETLVEELRAASNRISLAHVETVMLLAAAAEAHDRTTGKHLQNVRTISERLARELGYSDDDAQELGLAAVLHDIGKIRVADSVLANTGRLSKEEWDLMKRHAAWGEEFLTGRSGFELAATIARSHHERWDGGGYPDGLAGDDIAEVATIVAVADSFDAMTSDRPYKPGRSTAAAVHEIVACSGTQFSPKVVQALLRLHRQKQLPRRRPRRPVLEDQAA